MLPMFQLSRMSNCDPTDSSTTSLSSPHNHSLQSKGFTVPWSLVFGVLLAMFTLAGCGPESARNNQEDLTATTQQIALDYQTHRNLGQATSELETLDVANLNQWLMMVTESAVTSNPDEALTSALVALSTDLGLQSNAIQRYALQHNLVEAAVALAPEVINNTQPTPEPTPEIAVSVSQTTSVGALTSADPANEKVAENAPPVSSASVLTATPTLPVAVIVTPTLTPAPPSAPQVKAASDINVRAGPGTEYAVIAALAQSEMAMITGKNPASDWWEITLANGQPGWVYSTLVETAGDTNVVALALNIPTPPPTFTPAPTPEPLPTAQPVAPVTDPAAPTEAAPPADAVATPQAPAADPNGAPHFTMVSRRLWNKDENDGCIGKHLLRISVLDAGGARLNGIRLRGIYTGIELVTGDQGKGDGTIEFDLHGSGEGFVVLKNNDGREATSDNAEGFTTRSRDIDTATLIATGYCSSEADCQVFYSSYGCQGHHSWEAIFQRNY